MEQKIYKFKYILFFVIIISTCTAFSKTIIGTAHVIDGDTIHIGKNKIRLHGIDAPEIKQTCDKEKKIWNCGIESQIKLKKLLEKKEIRCEVNDIDRYKRYIAECFTNNLSINKYMVRNGWAIAYRYYSLKFVKDEEIAKKNKLGIWKSIFLEPYLFRKKNK